jgi:uracil-DNA glycosylase family 4
VADARQRFLRQLVELGEREIVLPGSEEPVAPGPGAGGPTAPAPDALSQAPPERTPRVAEPEPARAADRRAPKPAAPLQLPPGIVVEAPVPSADLFTADPIAQLGTLESVATAVEACRKCPLGSSRLNSVPGEGDPHAGFVCVGEAPGATEDQTGRPFVGRAGQLLNEILKAIGFAREEVFICNVLKCRPPNNRDPEPLEVHACSPYLHRQLELIGPRVILALGRPAAHALLGSNASLGDLRGRLHRYRGIPLIVTYHPAALLRNPHWKRPTWDDVRIARRLFDGEAV